MEMAFDGDEGTRWGAEAGSTSGWIEVDFGEPKAFDRAMVLEAQWNRTQSYRVEYLEGEEWKVAHEGETLGDVVLEFEPITAQKVRLNILEATDVPTLWEFHLYPPGVDIPPLVTGY